MNDIERTAVTAAAEWLEHNEYITKRLLADYARVAENTADGDDAEATARIAREIKHVLDRIAKPQRDALAAVRAALAGEPCDDVIVRNATFMLENSRNHAAKA